MNEEEKARQERRNRDWEKGRRTGRLKTSEEYRLERLKRGDTTPDMSNVARLEDISDDDPTVAANLASWERLHEKVESLPDEENDLIGSQDLDSDPYDVDVDGPGF